MNKSMIINIKENIVLGGLFFVVLLIIICLALLPLWKGHLQTDVVTFFYRYSYLAQNRSFAGISINEYQPGALLFFLIPGFFSKIISYSVYIDRFFYLNSILIFFHLLFYRLNRSFHAGVVFLLIILFCGPIILFRFELLVSILCLLGFWSWQKKYFNLSLFLLGIATSVKVYPVIFFPYLIFLYVKEKRKDTISLFLSYSLGLMLPVLITIVLGLSLEQIMASLAFHSFKPVGIEGVPGMVMTFIGKLKTGYYPHYIGAYGVNGIAPGNGFFNLAFYNYLWVIPITLFYLFFVTRVKRPVFSYDVPFLITILFLIFFKGLNPQYIYWFLLFFPMTEFFVISPSSFITLFLVLAIPLLTQIVYPITYTDFQRGFYSIGTYPQIFFINSLRNIFVIALALIFIKKVFFKKI